MMIKSKCSDMVGCHLMLIMEYDATLWSSFFWESKVSKISKNRVSSETCDSFVFT